MKNKITAILMEITLASNGATLSDHALTVLGQLAHLHDFSIVVDEIMTVVAHGSMISFSSNSLISNVVEILRVWWQSLCFLSHQSLNH